MTDEPDSSGEERIDDAGRNPTQRRIDEEGAEEAPVDAPWETEDATREPDEGHA
jgi:hypothetical protein